MRRFCILLLFTVTGCFSIVNNNGIPPQETTTVLGNVRQVPVPQHTERLPDGRTVIVVATPTPQPTPYMMINIEGNTLLPLPTPEMSDITRDLPNTPVTRQIVTDCLPCECAPCETPTPIPTAVEPIAEPCTLLDVEKLATILDRAGYTGQYVFCRAMSETLMIDVDFNGMTAILNSSRKKEFTALTRQNVPALKINNAMIQDELKGRSNAILSWLNCQLDKDNLPELPE